MFLGSLGNPNTVRNYGIGVGKTAERLGESRPLASVADDEIGEALELLWGTSSRRRNFRVAGRVFRKPTVTKARMSAVFCGTP